MLRVKSIGSKVITSVRSRPNETNIFHCYNGSVKHFHSSNKVENDFIFGGLAVMTIGLTLKQSLKMYDSYRAANPRSEPAVNSSEEGSVSETGGAKVNTADAEQPRPAEEKKKTTEKKTSKEGSATGASGGGFFANWNTFFARNFYDGGFEEKMTKREAALILGVRESANADRIKDAHRRIMQINHPDKGGSAYITAKVNEAKDMLLKGK
jgi:hypothetical protein